MSDDQAKVDELLVILYRTAHDATRALRDHGDSPEHIRNTLLHGLPDDPEHEAAVVKRQAVEDALAGRPPRR